MKTKNILLCSLFVTLTAIGAFIRVPFAFATISLQFLFTAFSGILIGKKNGAISQIIYAFIGLCGIPIFANGGGIGYVFNPTFGFIIGLIPAAYVIGFCCEKECTTKQIAKGCILGLAILYAVGVPYMAYIVNIYMGKGLSLKTILISGILLCLPGDIVKIVICCIIAPKVKRSILK